MANVTVSLDEKVLRWARVRAAELNTSVSRLLGEVLRDMMKRDRAYDAARRSYLSAVASAISSGDSLYPKRGELHERAGLR